MSPKPEVTTHSPSGGRFRSYPAWQDGVVYRDVLLQDAESITRSVSPEMEAPPGGGQEPESRVDPVDQGADAGVDPEWALGQIQGRSKEGFFQGEPRGGSRGGFWGCSWVNPGWIKGGSRVDPGWIKGRLRVDPGWIQGGSGEGPGWIQGGYRVDPGQIPGGSRVDPGVGYLQGLDCESLVTCSMSWI